MSNKQVHE